MAFVKTTDQLEAGEQIQLGHDILDIEHVRSQPSGEYKIGLKGPQGERLISADRDDRWTIVIS